MPTCVVPLSGGQPCGVTVHRAALNDREWGWADEAGEFFAPRFPSDPYAALERFAADMERYGHLYSRLKADLDLCGPNLHQHRAIPAPDPRPEQPEHCGWPAYLSPVGWECRQCRQPLQPLPAQTATSSVEAER